MNTLLLLLVASIWGMTFPLIKEAIQEIPPFLFNAVRFDLAAVCLIAASIFRAQRYSQRLILRGLFLGMFVFLGYAAQTLGLQYTSATNASFLIGLSVVFVPLLLFGLYRQKLRFKVLVSLVLALMGLFLLTGADFTLLKKGDLLQVFCAFCFAMHVVLVGRTDKRIEALPFTAVQMAAVAVLSHGFHIGFEESVSLSIMKQAWLPFSFTGILGSAFAYGVQVYVQKRVSEVKAALVFSTEPLWGALFSLLLIGEKIAPIGYLGGLFLVLSIYVVEFRGGGES